MMPAAPIGSRGMRDGHPTSGNGLMVVYVAKIEVSGPFDQVRNQLDGRSSGPRPRRSRYPGLPEMAGTYAKPSYLSTMLEMVCH
jgi:hypothetical protein